MANIKILFLVTVLLMPGITSDAQTNKRRPVRKVHQTKVEPNQADVLYETMLGSTARVMFIDSVVTDKNDLLSAIPLNKESGFLNTYDEFWKTTGHPSSYTYMNEFGNKVIFSMTGTDGHSHLYTADKLSGQWSQPRAITDFDADFEDINCPYMMSDGVTLYFAAKGKNSVGGYDLFVTMYDTDSARFYKPENIGLPFNSKANDYYYVIDEFNSLGWLVTDRNQPEGKVCVYTFIPSDSRQTYNAEATDEKKLLKLAEISSIRDSWTDRNKLQDALKRLAALNKRKADAGLNSMYFYINDKLVYNNPSQFVVQVNCQRYAKLTAMKDAMVKLANNLDALRRKYNTASKAERRSLAPTILKSEMQLEQSEHDIKTLEKEIRNTEISARNQ